MENSKLVRHIALLNKKECKKLDIFLHSPYLVNAKEQVFLLNLYEVILQHLWTNNQLALSKENAYKHVYPNDIYIKGKLDKLMTKLLKHFNRFLEFEYHLKTKKRASLYLAQANFFREKEAHKELEAVIQKGRHIQKKLPNKRFSDYYMDFLLEQEVLLYKSLLNNTRSTDTNLIESIEALDIYYLAQRLEYTARIKLQNYYVNNIDEQVYAAKKALISLIKNNYLDIPLIEAYFCVLSLSEDSTFKGIDTFEYLSSLLYSKKQLFSKDDNRNLKMILRMYVLNHDNLNQKNGLQRAFNLYKRDLEEGFLYHDKKLHPSVVKNVVDLGLALKENNWIYNFLQTHKEKIMGTETPHEVFNFNMANYYFCNNEYEKSLNLLNSTYEDVYYKVSAKRLEIKILFEQSSPLLNYKIDAFKIFIFRQNKKAFAEHQVRGNNNFIDALKKILTPKTLGNLERIKKISQKIKNTSYVSERKWLLTKLEEQKK